MQIGKKRSFLSQDKKECYLENADGNLVFIHQNGYQGNQHKYDFIQTCWLNPVNWNSRSEFDPGFFGFYSPSDISGHTRFYVQRWYQYTNAIQIAFGANFPLIYNVNCGNLFSSIPSKSILHLTIDCMSGKWSCYIDDILICEYTSSIEDFGTFTKDIGIFSVVNYDTSSSSTPSTYVSSMQNSRLYRYQAYIDDVMTIDAIPCVDIDGVGLKDIKTGKVIRPTRGIANYVKV